MSVRTTIDIPDEIYSRLRLRASQDHVSIRSLVIASIEQQFKPGTLCVPMTGPPVTGDGERGPLCPDTETPYDLVFG